ncbi:ferredoxin [Clostridium novyi A str. 4552]|uniref:Ferredoxin n=1 Tax=Clostridium novyi A str. 4552 TaxID=1444289 RepID=A0A0A0I8F8_CLONO|nr:[FeFe] hydrogenase, group A [Clostridium novyi]KGM96591.1 ferredoxin [Clostridium novyi A str. 4552]
MSRKNKRQVQTKEEYININTRKCIGCTACAINCTDITAISVLKAINNGKRTVTPKKNTFKNTGCIYCGQCTLICPTSAINVRSDVAKVKEALNSGKFLVLTAAPSLKATLGEEFGLSIGTDVEGKVQASARKLGFQKVYDTDFAADMTVVEESTELIKRLGLKENLPMFTSCCPSWVRWAELFKPDILKNLSTCKSPQQMMGATIKTYLAEKLKILPENIYTVSLKPCTSKKYEGEREEMGRDGYKDIDAVLTVREYAELLKEKGIDINALPAEKSDPIIGDYTGAGVIFGASGGVMAATLRNVAYYLKSDISAIDDIKFNNIYGTETAKEAMVNIGNYNLRVAVISTTSEVERFFKTEDWKKYDFIEVMSCPGGCINGGGTPKIIKKADVDEKKCIACGTCIENCPVGAIEFNVRGFAEVFKDKCVGCTLCSKICRTKAIKINMYNRGSNIPIDKSYVELRTQVLKHIDKKSKIKVSAENPELQEMYKSYIGEPDGEKATKLFHTTYTDRSSELVTTRHRKIKKKK